MNLDRKVSLARPREPAEAVRQRVRGQHVELRRMLLEGLSQVRGPLAARRSFRGELPGLVRRVRDLFVHHLADEEDLILPILEDDLPIGPRRAELPRAEHARQIAELNAICAWTEGDAEAELATRFDKLANALLQDIEEEDRDLLVPDVIRDDGVVVDQSGG
jgi:hypothetical protein